MALQQQHQPPLVVAEEDEFEEFEEEGKKGKKSTDCFSPSSLALLSLNLDLGKKKNSTNNINRLGRRRRRRRHHAPGGGALGVWLGRRRGR